MGRILHLPNFERNTKKLIYPSKVKEYNLVLSINEKYHQDINQEFLDNQKEILYKILSKTNLDFEKRLKEKNDIDSFLSARETIQKIKV
jgi:hypothetical protein